MSRTRWTLLLIATPALALAAASLALEGGTGPGAAGGGAAGGTGPHAPADVAAFDDAFHPVGRLRLRASEREPLGSITGLAFGPGGRVAVADRGSSRVFVFSAAGELRRVLGRAGAGPGEFREPTDVAFLEGGELFVAEAGAPRLTRFGPDLALDTVVHLDRAFHALRLAGLGQRLLAYVNAPGTATRRLRLLDADGRELGRFHPSHPAYLTTPYWDAATRRVLAAGGDRVVAGGNLIYPLSLYTARGVFVDSLGYGSPDWRPAPRPEPGAFRGPDQLLAFERWRRTFTTIQAVALVGERHLVISHQRLDPEVLAYEDAEYSADVYDLSTRRKLWRGIPLPGPVLAGGPSLTLLLARPPSGWVLGRYEIAG